jgi:hypothetical protein
MEEEIRKVFVLGKEIPVLIVSPKKIKILHNAPVPAYPVLLQLMLDTVNPEGNLLMPYTKYRVKKRVVDWFNQRLNKYRTPIEDMLPDACKDA